MARTPAKPKAATPLKPTAAPAAKPENTPSANEPKVAQAPDEAKANQQPLTDAAATGEAGGSTPPAGDLQAAQAPDQGKAGQPSTTSDATVGAGDTTPGAGDPEPEDKPGPVATIIGPEPGRRRIGRRFGPAPVHIPLEELTAEELAALIDDPALTVSIPGVDQELLIAPRRPRA